MAVNAGIYARDGDREQEAKNTLQHVGVTVLLRVKYGGIRLAPGRRGDKTVDRSLFKRMEYPVGVLPKSNSMNEQHHRHPTRARVHIDC